MKQMTEPEISVIDDPDYADAVDYLDPCPPLEEIVSPEVATKLLQEEENLP